jgi:endonuclease YncB( thermonuclease family)
MKNPVYTVFAAFTVFAFLALAFSSTAFAEFTEFTEFSGRVVAVADGDTITVLHDFERVKIRFVGIDAPEKRQAFGKLAKQGMSDLVFGREVRIEERKKDRYGRTLARVWVASAGCVANDCAKTRDAGLTLLARGLAWHYTQYAKEQPPHEREQYSLAEADARKQRLGLWRDAEPMPPWAWRHRS